MEGMGGGNDANTNTNGGWGEMGGNIGDGGFLNGNIDNGGMGGFGAGMYQPIPSLTNINNSPGGPGSSAPRPIVSPPPGGGSISRFAPAPADAPPTPQYHYQQQVPPLPPTGYAQQSLQARSAAMMPNSQSSQHLQAPMMYGSQQPGLYNQFNQQQQQPQYQQQPEHNAASYNQVNAGANNSTSVPPSSFAARSQQAYSVQQPPQQQFTQQPNMYQQQQSVSSGTSFTARANQLYGGNNSLQSQPHQQQVQGPQAQSVVVQPQMQQQSQQQMGGSTMSFADRSAQALYGGPTYQNQQPQSQPNFGNDVGNSYQPQFAGQQQIQSQMMYGQNPGMNNSSMQSTNTPYVMTNHNQASIMLMRQQQEQQQQQAMQQKLLTDSTRKIQEQAYYMRAAIEQNNIPVVFDRAAHMVGELGGLPHGSQQQAQQQAAAAAAAATNPNVLQNPITNNSGSSTLLTPKNYYELYMRALEEMPIFEEYLFNLSKGGQDPASVLQTNSSIPHDHIRIIDTSGQSLGGSKNDVSKLMNYTMKELYDFVQYCPRVVPRLYLQIAAGSALLRSNEVGAKFVLKDLQAAVKCEQNPIRGLFLRHYLLTSLKDKLPTQSNVGIQQLHGQHDAMEEKSANLDTESEAVDKGDDHSKLSVDATTTKVEDAQSVQANEGIVHPIGDHGTVEDSYEFILSNFMEMNKLWVRIQRLPGEGKNKDVKKRRERERNDLRILVGTNLVRLSQLTSVTSKIYGEIVLPRILDHIVVAGDPLSQAYIMDCLVQAFPDEYHIETLPILLKVCPRLRDKVNIRTILQGLMDRLANYLADEELLDESDTNEVKKQLARDSFGMFEECVQAVYNAKGPKLTSREVIRLQTSLLNFSIRCYPGNTEQVSICIASCAAALRQANASYEFNEGTVVELPQFKPALDVITIAELERFLSIPLSSFALKVLQFDDYCTLINILPWVNRREVAVKMIQSAVDGPVSDITDAMTIQAVESLFLVLEPLLRDEQSNAMHAIDQAGVMMSTMNIHNNQFNPNMSTQQYTPMQPHTTGSVLTHYTNDQLQTIRRDGALVSKLIHLLSDTKSDDVLLAFKSLQVARTKIVAANGGEHRSYPTLIALAFASLRLCNRIVKSISKKKTAQSSDAEDPKTGSSEDVPEVDGTVTSETNIVLQSESKPSAIKANELRTVFSFFQEVVVEIAKYNGENSVKISLDAALAADKYCASASAEGTDFAVISFEFFNQALATYDEKVTNPKAQYRCIVSIAGTLTSLKSISKDRYEGFITKTAQCAARMPKKHEQCHLIAVCAHLFYPVNARGDNTVYSNPQRALECLQRCLKLADASVSTNPAHLKLFVDILEHYVFFFERGNPLVTHVYISGLIALIKEHLVTLSGGETLLEAKAHFQEVNRYILCRKEDSKTAQLFAPVNLG